MLKKFFSRIFDIKRIIKRKNAQIRAEREKFTAAQVQNHIYASYILCLAAGEGEVRISKAEIAETVGKYRADVSATEDEYIIRVKEIADDKGLFSKAPASGSRVGANNGAKADKTGGEGLAKN